MNIYLHTACGNDIELDVDAELIEYGAEHDVGACAYTEVNKVNSVTLQRQIGTRWQYRKLDFDKMSDKYKQKIYEHLTGEY